MSNRDFSHVNLAQKKAAQTQYAASVKNVVSAALIPGYIVKGGVPPASTGIETVRTGAEAVGATVAPSGGVPATGTQDTVATSVKTGVNASYNVPAAVKQALTS